MSQYPSGKINTLNVRLKIITPLFLNGTDGKTPELRSPPIKAMLRFWWRAINSSLSLEEMHKKEGEIFGSSDEKIGKSKFSIRTYSASELKTSKESPLPGKDNYSSKDKAFSVNQSFGIKIRTGDLETYNLLPNLLKISSILGGLGKRSRRGFGSLAIESINGETSTQDSSYETILDLIEKLGGPELGTTKDEYLPYPYIKKIQKGKTVDGYKNILKNIYKSSHENDSKYTGYPSGSERLASPIYVSVIQDSQGKFFPIVTRLNCAAGKTLDGKDKSEEFISGIL